MWLPLPLPVPAMPVGLAGMPSISTMMAPVVVSTQYGPLYASPDTSSLILPVSDDSSSDMESAKVALAGLLPTWFTVMAPAMVLMSSRAGAYEASAGVTSAASEPLIGT